MKEKTPINILKRFLIFFKSQSKALDVLYAYHKLKPVSRIIVDKDDILDVIDYLKKYDLHTTISNFEIYLTEKNSNYSNKGYIINNPFPSKKLNIPTKKFLYISKNPILAQKAKEFEENEDNKNLGKILGYPECCCNFFEKHRQNEEKKENDYAKPLLRQTTKIINPHHTNILIREFDITPISHFPCSFECKESIKIAKKNKQILEKYDPEFAQRLFESLTYPVLIKENEIHVLKLGKQNGNIITFEKTYSNKITELSKKLNKHKLIKIINKNTIIINNKLIEKVHLIIFK